jgi:hypothetical protein
LIRAASALPARVPNALRVLVLRKNGLRQIRLLAANYQAFIKPATRMRLAGADANCDLEIGIRLDAEQTSTTCHARRSGRGRNCDREHGGVLHWEGISALCDSIRDVDRNSIGLTKGRTGATSRPCRRSSCLNARWTAACETVRPSAMGRRRRCWFGNGRNASDRHVSPACRHRSAGCCRQ